MRVACRGQAQVLGTGDLRVIAHFQAMRVHASLSAAAIWLLATVSSRKRPVSY
jgi:hypothetical protein